MTNAVELNVAINIDTLAFSISKMPHHKIIELFKSVDDIVCEYEFTEALAKTFQAVIDKENEKVADAIARKHNLSTPNLGLLSVHYK